MLQLLDIVPVDNLVWLREGIEVCIYDKNMLADFNTYCAFLFIVVESKE